MNEQTNEKTSKIIKKQKTNKERTKKERTNKQTNKLNLTDFLNYLAILESHDIRFCKRQH